MNALSSMLIQGSAGLRSGGYSSPSRRAALCLMGVLACIAWTAWAAAAADAPLTFNKEVAPIVFQRCSPCHRPGQPGPFPLLTYEDFRKRSAQVLEVVRSRFMPPWLPEAGYGTFVGERRLSTNETETLEKWISGGALEGAPSDLPALPSWSGGWALGEPDLVVTMAQPYALAAEGRDVYRNVVIPIPLEKARFVKGVEFRPGNARVVHHAFINVDETPFSRRLAAKEQPPGFDGMTKPETATMPGGHFLGWQPGKTVSFAPPGLSWRLNPGTDAVLQLHLHPSGKPELVQSSIGFYFTDAPPTNQMARLNLSQLSIDIPAGETNFWIEQNYTLPVDLDVLGISPHCHYLGRELQGFAILPDGSKKWLLRIKQWNFDWQGDYRYAEPQFLPRGSQLHMRFSYDNSTNNVRNPRNPPQRVRFGSQTTDEMGELWFQVLTRNPQDYKTLAADFYRQLIRWSESHNLRLVQEDPADAVTRTRLGRSYMQQGRWAEAVEQLQAAVSAKPGYDRAHFELGTIHLRHARIAEAQAAFETVVRLNPDDYEAQGSLGIIHMRQGNLDQAQAHLEEALKINAGDRLARENLNRVLQAKEALKNKPREPRP